MWATLATSLVSTAASHFLNKPDNTQNGNQSGNYNIRGYINNLPVDLEVERTGHQSGGGSRFPHKQPLAIENGGNTRSGSSSSDQLSFQNYNNSSSTSTNKSKNQKGNFTKKPNDEKTCKIVMPSQGNFEINIRKYDSGFAGTQKGGCSNNFRPKGQQQNVTQNQHQKGNQRQQNWQQNGMVIVNSNQNKSYQNKPNISGNQTVTTAKSQNKCQAKYQNRTPAQSYDQIRRKKNEQVTHYEPREFKPNKNNFGRKQIGTSTHHDRNLNSSYQGTWMYLGRLTAGTTEFAIKNYLEQKFPGNTFAVETLPLYKDAKLPCFKVKVNDRIFEEFRKPEHWPAGVMITKYIENFKS